MIRIKDEAKHQIILGLIAYVITFAVYNIGLFSTSDIILGIIFVIIYASLNKINILWLDISRKQKIQTHIISVVWTISYAIYAGDSFKHGLENRGFAFVYTVLSLAGLYALFFCFIRFSIFYYGKRVSGEKQVETNAGLGFSKKTWLMYSGIILLCMLPLFLMNYPGTMTVDSFDQLRQARGLSPFSDHHPWVHTLIIMLFNGIGEGISGNVTVGIGLYTFAQMILVAMSVAYAIATVRELGMKKAYEYIILFGFVLYPYNLAYAITMWKDVLFSAAVLVLTVTIYRVFVVEVTFGKRDISLFAICGIFMSLLRHNGFYAYILTMLVLIIATIRADKKKLVKLLTIFGVTLALVLIIKGPVQKICNVSAGDSAHNYTIPLQQVARAVVGNGASEEDLAILERINSIEYIRNNYIPGGADNMIQWLAAGDVDYFEAHKGEYIALWLKLGIKNPLAYINAFVDQTKGYYTTMMPEQIAYYGILPNEDGLDNFPLVGATVRIKIDELCSKLQDVLPVYGLFYSMGACFLVIILGIGAAVANDNKKIIYAYLPYLALILSVLVATPLVADLRYAYPLMMGFWTLVVMTLGEKNDIL